MATYSLPLSRWFYQGQLAAGGSLRVYQSGTTAPVTVYSDAGLTTPIANPITLDANAEAVFYVGTSVALRLDAYTAAGALIRSLDPVYPVSASAATSAGLAANIIDNPEFRVAQRAPSVATINGSTPVKTLDRWFGWTSTTASMTHSQQAAGLQGFANVLRVQRPNGNTSGAVHYASQIVESSTVTRLQGQSCTISFYARAGANFSAANSQLIVRVNQATGTDQGSASYTAGTWTSQTLALSASQGINNVLTQYSFTFAVAATTNEIAVDFGFVPTGTAGAGTADYFDITGVRLAAGALAAFDHRAFGEELERCQRYYEKSYDYAVIPGTAGAFAGAEILIAPGTNLYFNFRFKVRKRVAPSVSPYSPTSGTLNQARDITGGVDVAVSGSAGQTGASVNYTSATANSIYQVQWAADADL